MVKVKKKNRNIVPGSRPFINFKTRMHSSRMRTAHSLPYGVSMTETPPDRDSPLTETAPPPDRDSIPWTETPWTETPQTETPQTETPQDGDPLDRDRGPPSPWTDRHL